MFSLLALAQALLLLVSGKEDKSRGQARSTDPKDLGIAKGFPQENSRVVFSHSTIVSSLFPRVNA